MRALLIIQGCTLVVLALGLVSIAPADWRMLFAKKARRR